MAAGGGGNGGGGSAPCRPARGGAGAWPPWRYRLSAAAATCEEGTKRDLPESCGKGRTKARGSPSRGLQGPPGEGWLN